MSEEEEMEEAAALGWSAQQTRILTANGKANEYYTSQRGFDFDETELPHYHLLRRCRQRQQYYNNKKAKKDNNDEDNDNDHDSCYCNETHVMFRKWAAMQQQQQSESESPPFTIVGAWKRTIFYNNEMDSQECTTDATEMVYNIQTNTLFVDLRLPIATRQILHVQLHELDKHNNNKNNSNMMTLNNLNANQLRLYARQHVFAGFTLIQSVSNNNTPKDTVAAATPVVDAKLLCTRHHCIDWNFVGTPRARPNKWWVEPIVVNDNGTTTSTAWNEWAFATNHQGQHYYCERWERLLLPNVIVTDNSTAPVSSIADADIMDHETTKQRLVNNLVLALRKMPSTTTTRGGDEQDEQRGERHDDDGVIVCVGNHFNYCFYTQPQRAIKKDDEGSSNDNTKFSSLVDLVDDAVARGDLDYARAWLVRIQTGHGYITTTGSGVGGGWKVNAAIPQWHEEQQPGSGGLVGNKTSPMWQSRDEIKVVAAAGAMANNHNDDFSTAATIRSWTSEYCVSWNGELWEILECSLTTKTQLETILWLGLNASSRL